MGKKKSKVKKKLRRLKEKKEINDAKIKRLAEINKLK